MLTVLMTTYNGAATLPDVMDAFCEIKEPQGGWRLVIVDNGSTDRTQELLQLYRQRLPMTILYEPRRGKNVAVNAGLMTVSGDLIVFTDDDVLPQSDWLIQMRTAADSNPLFSIFGGSVKPKWETPPEDWIRNLGWPYLGVTYALTPALTEGPVEADYVLGNNMAIRADIFKAGHRFDTTIGPNGSVNYPMGSETEFVTRMNKAGFKSWYCKDAVIYHIVRPYQMDPGWMLRRAVRFGRGTYRVWAKNALDLPASVRIPRYLSRQAITWAQLFVQLIYLTHAKWVGNTDKLFKQKWWWNYYIGKFRESQVMGLKGQSMRAEP